MSEELNSKNELLLRENILTSCSISGMTASQIITVLMATIYEIFRDGCADKNERFSIVDVFETVIFDIEKQEDIDFKPDYMRTYKQRYQLLKEIINELGAGLNSISDENTQLKSEPAKLNQEVERLRALTEWKDISTAPKDGTSILLNLGNGDYDVCHYEDYTNYNSCKNGWYFRHGDGDSFWEDDDIESWMPLPKAPQIEGKQ